MHTLFDFIGHLKIQMGKVLAQNTRPCLRCRATGLGKKLEVSDTHREILATVLFWRFGDSEVSRQTKKSPILNDQLSARAARQDHLEIARPNVLLRTCSERSTEKRLLLHDGARKLTGLLSRSWPTVYLSRA